MTSTPHDLDALHPAPPPADPPPDVPDLEGAEIHDTYRETTVRFLPDGDGGLLVQISKGDSHDASENHIRLVAELDADAIRQVHADAIGPLAAYHTVNDAWTLRQSARYQEEQELRRAALAFRVRRTPGANGPHYTIHRADCSAAGTSGVRATMELLGAEDTVQRFNQFVTQAEDYLSPQRVENRRRLLPRHRAAHQLEPIGMCGRCKPLGAEDHDHARRELELLLGTDQEAEDRLPRLHRVADLIRRRLHDTEREHVAALRS